MFRWKLRLPEQTLCPAGNIRALVSEIAPRYPLDPTEVEIIKKYCLKGLTESGIPAEDMFYKLQSFQERLRDIIERFVYSRQARTKD